MRHKILVVDDQPLNVSALIRLLKPRYEVIAAHSAEEALAILTHDGRNISLILSDKSMPGRSGLDLLEEARSLSPAVRVLLTAYPETSDLSGAINHGEVYRYVTKPWDPDKLNETVQQALDHYELEHEQSEVVDELKRKNDELRQLASRVADALLKRHQTLHERNSAEVLPVAEESSAPHAVFATLSYSAIRDAASAIVESLAVMQGRLQEAKMAIEPEYVEMITSNCLSEARRILALLADVSGGHATQRSAEASGRAIVAMRKG